MSSSVPHVALSVKGSAADLGKSLRAGRVYRREDLARVSTAVDRHLRELVTAGQLTKLAQGLYYAPQLSVFGAVPPDDQELIGAFLRDKDFLIFSPSAYNSLGLGTTQIYNRTVVYNHKRHGIFTLGSREFDCRVKPRFPNKLTPEFLLVDMLNNLDEVIEDKSLVLGQAESKINEFDRCRLLEAVRRYGSVATRKRVMGWVHA